MTKDEALRLAWDALDDIGDEWGFTSQRTVPKRKEAITAIKEALAQPEQEPVAVYRAGQAKGEVYHVQFLKGMEADEVLLYATPPQRTWVGLTDEEKQEWIDAMPSPPQPRHFMVLVNAIESELKEKNT